MDREKYIDELVKKCEGVNCADCPIGRIPNLQSHCVSLRFADIDDEYLEFYASFLGLKIDAESDPVNKASHYNDGGIECIDAIEASMPPVEYAGFLKGQVLKYVWRYRLKGKPTEDLKKARYYLDRLIQITEKEATV